MAARPERRCTPSTRHYSPYTPAIVVIVLEMAPELEWTCTPRSPVQSMAGRLERTCSLHICGVVHTHKHIVHTSHCCYCEKWLLGFSRHAPNVLMDHAHFEYHLRLLLCNWLSKVWTCTCFFPCV
jgi:hypothetical protein